MNNAVYESFPRSLTVILHFVHVSLLPESWCKYIGHYGTVNLKGIASTLSKFEPIFCHGHLLNF